MRAWLKVLVLMAPLVVLPRVALAEDAGGSDAAASDSGAAADAAGDDGGASGDMDASQADVVVIACDGALCDTLQGRPSCEIAAGSPGSGAAHPAWAAAAVLAVGIVALRRSKRGALRPGRGGAAC